MKKNHDPNFFAWYYEKGLLEFLEIWKNFLKFSWRFFSVGELILTWLSPWKRDISFKNWRGFDPQKTISLFFGNIVSRFLGAIVRSAVILAGLSIFSIICLVGLVGLIFWLIFPLLLVWTLFKAFGGSFFFVELLGLLFVYLVLVICAYYLNLRTPFGQMNFQTLYSRPIFERICNRLGLDKKDLSKKVLKNSQKLTEFLKSKNLSMEDFAFLVNWETAILDEERLKKSFWRWENLSRLPAIGAGWKYAYTVKLDRYSRDISVFDGSEYRDRKLVGRQDEVELLKLILQRPDQNCALIVGGSGIGKNTLIHDLAARIRHNQSEKYFLNKRILELDLGRVISDAISSGEDSENALRNLFLEAAYAGNIILIIDHLEQFLGKEGTMLHPDISPVLNEFLSHPNFQIIATSSPKEYHRLIEKYDQIAKYFEVIEMREPSESDMLKILYNNFKLQESGRVIFTHEAFKSIIKESNRYNWSSPLPERALDLAMDVLMFWEKKSEKYLIDQEVLADFLSLKTGTAHGEIKNEERKKLLNLEKFLHRQVIGQEEAVKQVAEALRRSRSGIANSQKPVGTFLFLGPTGVGKTETAKALAKMYFGDENKMIRFDMSEFQTPSSIDRLLGSSQLNQPGRLTSEVKDNPYSLVLLDEIEKAYPEILDVFLQILDEGFVTDAFGEKINFRNVLIIATSNVGAALIKESVEKNEDPEKTKQQVIDYAVSNNVFRVEFLNRFDSVIFFRPLNEKELESVVKLMLKKLARRLQEEKNIEIEFGENVGHKIIEKGYNPIFGARSIDHYIEDSVEDFLSKKIIAGEVEKGQKIRIDL